MLATSPLPPVESPQFQESGLGERANATSVYTMIPNAEAQAIRGGENENIISARVAGFLVLELGARYHILGSLACSAVVQEVVSLSRDPEHNENGVVFMVGKRHRDLLIRGFRTSTLPYPPPSLYPSPPFYDKLEDMIKASLEPSDKDYETARKKALARDGFRCMITGMFDETSLKLSAELRRKHESLGGMPITVKTCHILSESTQGVGTNGERTTGNETHYAAGVLSALKQFGIEDLATALQAVDGAHEIWNLLSLEHNLHSKFDSLDLWFEGTDKPNCYKICFSSAYVGDYIRGLSRRPGMSAPGAPIVVDLSPNCEGVPPPSRELLALHAVCARVAHMSGAAEFLDKLELDAEETEVLAFDGSSAHLLSNLISPYAAVRGVA